MKVSDILLEVFDSHTVARLTKSTADAFSVSAMIGDRKIVFDAERTSSNIWEIAFSEKIPGRVTTGKTGSGNEFRVFAFVFDCVKELVARYHPELIQFTSDNSDLNRTKLYKAMATKLVIPGYKSSSNSSNKHYELFSIIKDK